MTRFGATLLEVVLALVLGALLLALAARVVTGTRASARDLTTRSQRLAAVRVVRTVLAADGPGIVHGGVGADTLGVRAHRGTAVSCGAGGPPWTAEVVGVRLPDPSKDSVLVLDRSGRWSVHALADAVAAPGACGGGSAQVQRWTLEPPPVEPPVVARYFERGSYHLVGDAFRYRRGLGGRQPLTAPILATSRGGFVVERGMGRARLHFHPDDAGAGPGAAWLLPLGRAAGALP